MDPQAVTLITWNPLPIEVSDARQCVFWFKESTHFVSSRKDWEITHEQCVVFLQPGAEAVDRVGIKLPATHYFKASGITLVL